MKRIRVLGILAAGVVAGVCASWIYHAFRRSGGTSLAVDHIAIDLSGGVPAEAVNASGVCGSYPLGVPRYFVLTLPGKRVVALCAQDVTCLRETGHLVGLQLNGCPMTAVEAKAWLESIVGQLNLAMRGSGESVSGANIALWWSDQSAGRATGSYPIGTDWTKPWIHVRVGHSYDLTDKRPWAVRLSIEFDK